MDITLAVHYVTFATLDMCLSCHKGSILLFLCGYKQQSILEIFGTGIKMQINICHKNILTFANFKMTNIW